MMWTEFWDMHSGGGLKEDPYHMIYIEAPEKEAISVFYSRFGHNPNRVSCTCCGEDYSISSEESLEQLTGFHRGCKYDEKTLLYIEEENPNHYSYIKFMTVEEYIESDDVLIIKKEDIESEEYNTYAPVEGYVYI